MSEPASYINSNQVWSEEAALASLLQRGDLSQISISSLSREWNWGWQKVNNRLDRWAAEGKISRQGRGRSMVVVIPSESTTINVIQPQPVSDVESVTVSLPTVPKVRIQDLILPRTFSLLVAILAGAIAWYGLRINAWYGSTLGKTADASHLFSGLSLVGDAVALAMPSIAHYLWRHRKRVASSLGWAVWVITLIVALLGAIGFSSINIADTTAGRDKIAALNASLRGQIARLQRERESIQEKKPVTNIEAQVQTAQSNVPPGIWKSTSGCNDVTRSQSGEACATVLRLRQELSNAKQRDEIDIQLREAGSQLAELPPIFSADPQAETAASLVNWVTNGTVAVTTADINMIRLLSLLLLQQLAGMLFMLAIILWTVRPVVIKE